MGNQAYCGIAAVATREYMHVGTLEKRQVSDGPCAEIGFNKRWVGLRFRKKNLETSTRSPQCVSHHLCSSNVAFIQTWYMIIHDDSSVFRKNARPVHTFGLAYQGVHIGFFIRSYVQADIESFNPHSWRYYYYYNIITSFCSSSWAKFHFDYKAVNAADARTEWRLGRWRRCRKWWIILPTIYDDNVHITTQH